MSGGLGDVYTSQAFDIKLGKKALRLIPTGSAAAHSEGAEGVEDGGDASPESATED